MINSIDIVLPVFKIFHTLLAIVIYWQWLAQGIPLSVIADLGLKPRYLWSESFAPASLYYLQLIFLYDAWTGILPEREIHGKGFTAKNCVLSYKNLMTMIKAYGGL